jgi:hypothetical protein
MGTGGWGWTATLAMAISLGCATTGANRGGTMRLPDLKELEAKRARYADVEITVDPATVSLADRGVLEPLVRAGRIIDRIFWKQASKEGLEVEAGLRERTDAMGRVLADYVRINAGPWDRLDDFEPFHGTRAKPPGATFYPEDLSRESFESWLKAHPGDREAFESPVTVIRRDGDRLVAVPFAVEYRDDLQEAARLLEDAAARTRDAPLAKYLASRAAAFRTNDYYPSDLDWMDLGTAEGPEASAIEVVIGPYEVYEDRLMNLKASFESFVTVRDAAESRKLAVVAGMLDELEASLPIDDRHKNFSRGKSSPIAVVQVVYASGDTAAGVQTTAFNLPNDERVRAAKGSKKVLLKNVGRAKFDKSLVPIARILLDPSLLKDVSFDAYFDFVLLHEVSHGLGPGILAKADGTSTTVNLALRDTYSGIEECKADVLGVLNTLHLVRKGILSADVGRTLEPTFLAGLFRSIRFGIGEAHGIANMVQFNWLRKAGAVTCDAARGTFGIDSAKFEPAMRDLGRALLTVQAEGDCDGARAILATYGGMPEEVESALKRLASVPVDIRPIYTLGRMLSGEAAEGMAR